MEKLSSEELNYVEYNLKTKYENQALLRWRFQEMTFRMQMSLWANFKLDYLA